MFNEISPSEDDISKRLRLNKLKIVIACYIIIDCLVVIGELVDGTNLAGPGLGLTLLIIAVPVSVVIFIVCLFLFLTNRKKYRNTLIINALGTLSLLLTLPACYLLASIFK